MGPLAARSLGQFGLKSAIDRVSATDTSPNAVTVNLAEALWWVKALEDWHRKVHGEDTYFNLIRVGEGGDTVAGLAWARNLVGHELVNIATIVVVGWGGEPIRWGSPVWRKFDDVPEAKKDQYDRHLSYDDFIAGKPLDEPLRTALDFFLSAPASDR